MRRKLCAVLIALSACAPRTEEVAPPVGPVLPFLADDYAAALAAARERDLPVFIDSWALW